MVLTNQVYNVLKWIAQYFLPALGTLYFALASIWGLPYGEEVVGTVTAIDLFLGTLLGLSSHNYKGEGTLYIDTQDEAKDIYRLAIDTPLNELPDKSEIMIKINADDPSELHA
ncbi:MAG: holin [Chaetfec virus UA24_144]|nr:MAG: holin [Chaetfec virus UA24_144]